MLHLVAYCSVIHKSLKKLQRLGFASMLALALPCSIALDAAVHCFLKKFSNHKQAISGNMCRRALLQCVMLPALRYSPLGFQAEILKGWVPHLIAVASPDTQPGSLPGLRRWVTWLHWLLVSLSHAADIHFLMMLYL